MKYLAIIRAVIDLIPFVIEGIKIAEAALPGEGKGEQKLIMVRSFLEGAYVKADDAIIDFNDLWGPLTTAISGIVAAYNASEVFKK